MKRLLILSGVVLFVLAGVYFSFIADNTFDQQVPDEIVGLKSDQPTTALDKKDLPAKVTVREVQKPLSVNEEKTKSDDTGIAGTPAEAEVVRRWELERGYLGKDSQKSEEYKNYDMATLKIMVDSGDVLAQSEVVRRSYGEARTNEIHKALAMGSTSAIMVLGFDLIGRYENTVDSLDRHKLIKEAFAVYEMGSLRGDRYNQIVIQNEFTKKYNIQLTEEDKQAIKQRGKEFYDEIQQLRFELGMKEFDNSVPPEVSNYFDNWHRFTYDGAFRN